MTLAPSLETLVMRRMSRRSFLGQTSGLIALSALGPLVTGCSDTGDGARPSLRFREIAHQLDETHHVSENYSTRTLIAWGDRVFADAPAFDVHNQSAQAQVRQFGYNCDFIGYLPLGEGATDAAAHLASANSARGILCVNHEYPTSHLMFAGARNSTEAYERATSSSVAVEMASLGVSIFEVARAQNGFATVPTSRFSRRIHASTEIAVSGPARGDVRMRTRADPAGLVVAGTFANCAGAVTPWGTMLSAEENVQYYFSGDANNLAESLAREKIGAQSFGITGQTRMAWSQFDDRFNIEVEPFEPNRFGWIVEIDPYDPTATPKKRTALGRFKHEAATVVAAPGKPVVVYMGDDEAGQFIYRFVSRDIFDPARPRANMDLLDDGVLSVARLSDDGTGEWLPLVLGERAIGAASLFESQADVVIDARRAAKLRQATPMDRPEDIETSPVTGRVYVALTGNSQRTAKVPGSTRGPNLAGHILEIMPPGSDGARDHFSATFTWNVFITAGDPAPGDAMPDDAMNGHYGDDVSESGWFANPDNLVFDPLGRLWIATDGANKFGFADGLWAVETDGDARAVPRAFFACPRGAELCGPAFTPDGKTLFVAVQHPGQEPDSHFDKPSTRWPDFDPNMPPRPAVLAITKDDGDVIGS